jgi:diguanylate cyclase (GGDEF)-like protein
MPNRASLETIKNLPPKQALIQLRRLFCHARHSQATDLHQIVVEIARNLYYLGDFEGLKVLVSHWLESYNLPLKVEVGLSNLLAVSYHVTGYLSDAYTMYNRAIKRAKQLEDMVQLGHLYHNLGRMVNDLGDLARACDCYTCAVDLFGEDDFSIARANLFYAVTLAKMGQDESAIAHLQFSWDVFVRLNDEKQLAHWHEAHGDVQSLLNNTEMAVVAYQKARVLLSPFHNYKDCGEIDLKLGALYLNLGKFDEAIVAIRRGIEILKNHNLEQLLEDAYMSLGFALEAQGFYEDAVDCFKKHKELVKKMETVRNRIIRGTMDVQLEKHVLLRENERIGERRRHLKEFNVQMEKETRAIERATEKLVQLRELALALTRAKSNEEIYEVALEFLPRVVSFSQFLIGLIRENPLHESDIRERQVCFECVYIQGELREPMYVSTETTGYVQHAIAYDQIIRLDEVDSLSFLGTPYSQSSKNELIQSAIFVPLRDQNEVFGLITVQHFHPHFYDGYDEAVFSSFCSMIASALAIVQNSHAIDEQVILHQHLLSDLKEKNMRLAHMSYHDALTGLFNRTGLSHAIDHWFSSSVLPTELVVAVMDIDHFKQFNDHYGHIAGDDLISKLGDVIRDSFNRQDYLIARFGGEEFLVVASAGHFRTILTSCETLRKRVHTIGYDIGLSVDLSISIGVQSASIRTREDLYALIEGADQRLYKAKEMGRNRICSA